MFITFRVGSSTQIVQDLPSPRAGVVAVVFYGIAWNLIGHSVIEFPSGAC
jgi:hypothetical protein